VNPLQTIFIDSVVYGWALTFVQEIGELAEAEGHHPNISFGWGNATISLQTKKIKGLHENDFIMATKIDRIFARAATA
jgi:4a-hydroxytetrahydrobiopterin dehydratase